MRKIRNPAPLGLVRGPGLQPACKNFEELELFQASEISFQLLTDTSAIVGYADMEFDDQDGIDNPHELVRAMRMPSGALHMLVGVGDRCDIRLESGFKELNLGDFAIYLPSEGDVALVTARY